MLVSSNSLMRCDTSTGNFAWRPLMLTPQPVTLTISVWVVRRMALATGQRQVWHGTPYSMSTSVTSMWISHTSSVFI